MDIPKKRRRTEEVDFKKCIICQRETTESLVKNISIDAFKNILFYVFSRAKFGESEFAEANKRLEGVSEEDLKQSGASVHASCRKSTVSSEKLKRAQTRFEKAVASKDVAFLSRAPGRPSHESKSCLPFELDETSSLPQRLSRNVTAAYSKELCFFCQTHDEKQPVHAIQTESRGKQLHDFVKNCDNNLYKVNLSSAIKPDDALSIDVKYHRTCWTKHVVRAADNNPPIESVIQDNEIAANIEFLNLIRSLLEKGRILSLEDAYNAYLDILQYHLCESPPSRKFLRELLITNIDGIEFVRAFRRNESDRFYLTETKIAAIDSAAENTSDSDLKVIFRCSKILRQEILQARNWQFDGTLNADMKEMVPTKLITLLQWIFSGVATELKTEKRIDDINKKAVFISQQIMYEVKTDRQVKHTPKSDEMEKPFRHQREYPLQVGVGILAHKQFRSRSLTDLLHKLAVSVDYTRILRIETQLAEAVVRHSAEHGIYVPPEIARGQFVYFAVDNSDFSEDTPDGKNTLHATAMAVFQRKTNYVPELTIDLSKNAISKSLPSNAIPATELLQCHVPSNAQPKCYGYDRFDTGPSQDITDASAQDDLAWSVGQSLARSRSENLIPTWAAYNSEVSSSTLPLTTVAMMPLLAAPAHEWSTMLTVLKQAQNITTVVMGENHKTVITFDLQLYEKAVKLQLHTAPALDHLVFRLGELHTVMTALRALGTSIEDSGFDDAWVEAGIYGSTTKHQILQGNHMKRALTAHSITNSVLSDLHVDAFLKTEKDESGSDYPNTHLAALSMNASCQEGPRQYSDLGAHHKEILRAMATEGLKEKLHNFDLRLEQQHPMVKFANDYMKFVACILMFIRATREGHWKLHLESLKSLCKYFFAHDRLNYARMVPLYLAQMKQLESSDPDIHEEFMKGNFCVNKNDIPFCAVGPDHAIEHENKTMKIQGGLKGLTQQPAAMARWFLIAPELSRLAGEAEALVGIQTHSSMHHHDLSKAVINRFNENVKKLKEVFKENDPFSNEETELVNIITKAVMPGPVKDAVLTRDKVGQDLFSAFVKERIVERKLSVWSPMTKLNLQTWKTTRSTKKSKTTSGAAALKDDRALFARFLVVVLSRPEIDLKESISEFELATYPRTLFNADGELRHCIGKSKLMNILENLLPQNISDTDEEPTQHTGSIAIIDGMAVVQSMGKPTWVRTGRDLATHFLEIIDKRSQECDEVHIIFDRYDLPNSLKEGTRQFRQGCNRSVVYHISDDAVIEKIALKQLVGSSVNKESLAIYFASHILECNKDSSKTYVVTLKDECKSNKLSVEHLASTQEEADTRMLLHAIDATERGATSIRIQSPDTDVLVLALWNFPSLSEETSVVVGTGAKRRSIPLLPLYNALGGPLVAALPGFHSFTGCDQTGAICGKSKLSCWNTLMKADQEVLEGFASLGSSVCVPDHVAKKLELFMCHLYVPLTHITTVKEMRWFLFSKKQYADEKLPPTKAALEQMIKRANYVALVWKECGTPCPDIPPPTSQGWIQDGDRLQAVPTTLPPAPKAVLELIKCNCKGSCITMSCSCKKHSLKCTDMCGCCETKCENRNAEEITVAIEDSDDEDLLL